MSGWCEKLRQMDQGK